MGFDVVRNTIAVTIQVEAIRNTVAVGVHSQRSFDTVEQTIPVIIEISAIDDAVTIAITVTLPQVIIANEVVAGVIRQRKHVDLLTRVVGRNVEPIIVFHQAHRSGANTAILKGVHEDLLPSLPVDGGMYVGREVEREREIVGARIRCRPIGARGDRPRRVRHLRCDVGGCEDARANDVRRFDGHLRRSRRLGRAGGEIGAHPDFITVQCCVVDNFVFNPTINNCRAGRRDSRRRGGWYAGASRRCRCCRRRRYSCIGRGSGWRCRCCRSCSSRRRCIRLRSRRGDCRRRGRCCIHGSINRIGCSRAAVAAADDAGGVGLGPRRGRVDGEGDHRCAVAGDSAAAGTGDHLSTGITGEIAAADKAQAGGQGVSHGDHAAGGDCAGVGDN